MSSRLGKGLGELFKENYSFSEEPQQNEVIIEVEIEKLRENPYQPRTHFDEDKINELAQSIKEHGVFQPIIIKKSEAGYYIVAGERRFRACKKIGLKSIPAIVRDIDDQTMAEIALLENLQRENLSIIEEAMAYRMLMDKYAFTQQEVAERVGKSRSHITNILRILNLPKEVQALVRENKIEFGHAKILAGLNDEELIKDLALQVSEEKLSVRQLEILVKEKLIEKLQKPKDKGKDEQNIELTFLQDELITKLGTSVKIVGKDNKGKLVVDFNSIADLNRILTIMKLID
jgi:ParB family transcriptional regulator, chromosome partitioning protein